jgi:rubredoxin
MSLSLEGDCPECGAEEFYKAASMSIQLGTKEKWRCTGCSYGYVTINGIDTSDPTPVHG